MVLLARHLCPSGATCFLVPGELRERELPAIAPDFVLLDNLRRSRFEIATRLMDAGVSIGVLDNEGGVFSSFDWYGDALNPDVSTRHRIAAFCSWGTRLAEYVIEQDWYRKEQVHVTGHPRFDFYASELKNIKLSVTPDSSQWKKPLVLISGRYSLANPLSGNSEKKSELVVKLRNYDSEHAHKLLESQRRGMSQMVDLVNALASRFPGVTFVYRPHPFEKLETYHDLLKLKEYSNLHLSKQGTIHGWLALADAVIHRGCTTAIEAGMLDVPALSPRWVDTPEEIESSESVSIPCAHQQELEERIAQLEQGVLKRPENIKAKHDQVIHDWFCKTDGQAHQRVAKAILENISTTVDIEKCRQLFNEQSQDKGGLRGIIKSTLGRGSAQQRRWMQSDKAFDPAQVDEILRAIAESTPNVAQQVEAITASEENGYRVKHNGCSVMLRCR